MMKKVFFFFALFFLFSSIPFEAHENHIPPTQQPNFVLFFADDMGWGDMGSYGHPTVKTPQLDALARKGQKWTNFYAVESVCSPSRAGLLTGRLPIRSGLYGEKLPVLFENDPYDFPSSEETLAEALKKKGYTTGIIGKWHLGNSTGSLPTKHGFDYWYGIPYSNDMPMTIGPSREEILKALQNKNQEFLEATAQLYIEAYTLPKETYWDVSLFESKATSSGTIHNLVEKPAQQNTLTERFTQKATSFIRQNKNKPFFLYVPYAKPHVPLFPGKNFKGKSAAGIYGDAIEEIDWSVGEIVKTLKKLGLHKNTLVVFTSDNGPWLKIKRSRGSAGPFRGGKRSTWEGGVRVPALFWWPGKISPHSVWGMGSTLDLFPTFLSLASVPSENRVLDGVNLRETLFHRKPSPRKRMPYFLAGQLRAFREGPYKIHLKDPETGEAIKPRVFHLGHDPGEKINLAKTHPHIIKSLRKKAKRLLNNVPKAPPLFDRRLQ